MINNDNMDVFKYIKIWVFMLLALLVTGCSEDEVPPVVADKPVFVMYIQLPESVLATTRSESEYDIFADLSIESRVKSLDVWVFPSGNSTQIDMGDGVTKKDYLYDHLDAAAFTQGVTTITFNVGDDFLVYNDGLTLDIYVVVNASSIGKSWNLQGTTTKAELENIVFGFDGDTDTYFGTTTLTTPADIDDDVTNNIVGKGLPMSGYLKNAAIISQDGQFTTDKIFIKRSVSKLRFVLAKAAGMAQAKINSIKLDGGKIPTNIYIFRGTEEDNGAALHDTWTATTYVTNDDITWNLGTVSIPEHPNPASLKWGNSFTPQAWEDALNDAIDNGTALEYTRIYLRESPLKLSGTINYQTINGDNVDKDVNFEMDNEGDILRNHSWTVYIYLYQGGLVFEVAKWGTQSVDVKPFI